MLEMSLMESPVLQAKRGTVSHILLRQDSGLSLVILIEMACVTNRKRKLSHWCGRDTGSYGPMTCVHRKILQFPADTAATVSQIVSHYQHHLKVIPRHRHWAGTVLLYRTVNDSSSHTHTQFLYTVRLHTNSAFAQLVIRFLDDEKIL